MNLIFILFFYLTSPVAQNTNPFLLLPRQGSGFSTANWDTTRIYSGSGTLQKIAIGNKLKGISDDTIRIATGQSTLRRNALILTDTSTMPPMKWRADSILSGIGNNGIISVAIGDVDADGINEVIFGQAGGNLKRVKWIGGAWNVAQIDSQGTAVYDIAIGDADNNGVTDIIFARYRYVFRAYWTGSAWQTNQIWSGDGSLCQGVAIGNFDNASPGNEIVAVTNSGKAVKIRWTGSSWENYVLFTSSGNFYDPAIGDFDTLNSGNEIVFGNGSQTINIGSVIELYGSGINWSTRAIYTPTFNESYQNLSLGDVLDESQGIEVVGIGIGNDVKVRVIYGSGSIWTSQIVTSFGYTSAFGIAVGDVNKYRSLNQEIVFARNTILYEAEQRLPPGPVITNISHTPIIPLSSEDDTVSAKIYDSLQITVDSLYYAINAPTAWQSVGHFNTTPDSMYYFAIPAQDTGTIVFYFIKAKNNSGGVSQSPIFSYQVAYEHNIYQIQHILGPSDTSPDNNKYVHTKGIVTGVFGRYFNIEEEPGGAWHGIHIRRPAFTDTVPSLAIGDSVTVLGRVAELANQTVTNVFYDSGGRTQKITSGHPLPCTTIARIPQIAESLEGSLVKIDTVRFKTTGTFQANTAYWAYSFAETESITVFIRSETNLPNESIPQGYLCLTGNLNQYVNNYQTIPRAMIDLQILPVDFGAVQILAPMDSVNYGDSLIPKVIIQNFQLTPVTNLSVWLHIGNTYNNERFFSKLGSQSIDTIEFAIWFDNPGWHRITAYTRLRNDLNPNNDTVFDSVYVRPPSQPPDVGVTAILSPPDTIAANDTIIPKVEIRNFSTTPAVNFYTIFKIGNIFSDSIFIPNLGLGQSDTIEFQQWVSMPDSYRLISYTKNSVDPNPSNDTAYGSLYVSSTIGFWEERKSLPLSLRKIV